VSAPPPTRLLGGGGGGGGSGVPASPPPPPQPIPRPAALAGRGTVVVDARPCLREGEFPPRRRGRPGLQPFISRGPVEALRAPPRVREMADRGAVGLSAPPSTRRPGVGRQGSQVERGGQRGASPAEGAEV
jgi:hypothetical protein